jgi:hypothetical protein
MVIACPTLPWVGLFRRHRETLNERLLREAGYDASGEPLDEAEGEPVEQRLGEPMQEPGQEPATARPLKEASGWDASAVAEDPLLRADHYAFVALPDGTLVVDGDVDEDLSRLADAVEQKLAPPYRADALRVDDRFWAIEAKQVDIVELPDELGDVLELTQYGEDVTLTVDGAPADPNDAPTPLCDLGERSGSDYAVLASRLDDTLFEVYVTPL